MGEQFFLKEKGKLIEVGEDVDSIQVVVHLFQLQGNLEEAT